MSDRIVVIKVGIANRIMIYWVPLIFLFFAARNLAWFSPTYNLKQGLFAMFAAAVYVLGFEVFIFGFRVELGSNAIEYRCRGFPFAKTVRIVRSHIRRATYEAKMRTDGKPWRFVRVVHEGPVGRVSTLINLTAFSMRDVKKILDWMPHFDRD